MSESTIILGVDTALRCTGYGVVEVRGRTFKAVDCGVIKNKPKDSHSECLRRIAGGIRQLVDAYTPDIASIEGAFFFKNAKTAMILGMARGTVVSVLAERQIPCYEYAPARAKQAITGHGRAGKEQVAAIMSGMLGIDVSEVPDDSTDALALCVCHALTAQSQGGIHVPAPL